MAQIALLPGPQIDKWEWQYQGNCVTLETDLFFHPEGERGASRRRRAEAAKSICATCPVLLQCREHALGTKEPYGIWGGMTEEERRKQLRAKAS